jgi:hypothetical protein
MTEMVHGGPFLAERCACSCSLKLNVKWPPWVSPVVMFNVLEKSVVDSVDLVFDPTESCCVLTVLFVVLAVQTHDESHDWSATTD